MLTQEPKTIHYTELTSFKPTSKIYTEWETYRREAGRLLTEGNEGKHVLIKGDEIVGIWETRDAAVSQGVRRFGLDSFLVHQIQTREPLLRLGKAALWLT